MAASDALVVGEEWISEHYFTSDAKRESFLARVLARRKEWDEAEKEDIPSTRSRYRAAHGQIETLFAGLVPFGTDDASPDATAPITGTASDTTAADLYALLREIFGYETGEFSLIERGPVTLVRPHADEGAAPAALLTAKPVETVEDLLLKDSPTLTEPWMPVDLADPDAPELEGADPVVSVSRALSTLLTDEHGPAFAVVFAGRWALLTERERWPEGRWLAVDLQVVVERNELTKGGEADRALAILDAQSVLPAADGTTWWLESLEDSAAHTVGVSRDLREGVRLSIEIIANDVVRRRAAQGLPPLGQKDAQPLALQALRYLYRIIFLLYAEASPELGVLPVGASEYDAGYGLDRLRELTQREIHEETSKSGTHVYESLDLLFRLVDRGFNAEVTADQEDAFDGLVFQPLRADLFKPENTAFIDEVQLGNDSLLRVLRHLLLTKGDAKQGRGFISYVELGINQLGAVYEGLMSYTGSFATERLWEVAKDGDASEGSWVVPQDVMEGIAEKDFVTTTNDLGEKRNVTYEPGTFVFRLSGRDRKRSASYYTPEVLTRFTVQQALEELLDHDGHTTTAEEILNLTVCEPALGSGAFAIEAVRQLAEQYLSRRERELGERVDPEDRPRELAKVKAHIALHQVYGVDLNATAVELAEVSLWLDTMVEGLAAPWFGLRLRRGNSLVGAKRALYHPDDLKRAAWLMRTPSPEPLSQVAEAIDAADVGAAHRPGEALDLDGRIHHFLLPAKGWGSAVGVPKQVRDLVDPEHLKELRTWRRTIAKAPTKTQKERLQALARRVEVLWEFTLRRLRIAEQQSARHIDLWGRDTTSDAAGFESDSASTDTAKAGVSREEIEAYLGDPNSAYRRLRLVMDAWCALWYWPLNKPNMKPPTLEDWIDALEGILGTAGKAARDGTGTLADASTWEELALAEETELKFAGARDLQVPYFGAPWLFLVERVARDQGFFHWELDFATVFARGGFDLQVGNPPWVRPRTSVDELLAEGDPWWTLQNKPSVADKAERLPRTLNRPGIRDLVITVTAELVVQAAMLGDPTVYSLLSGQPDLYRAFMCATWERQSAQGVSSLVHPESHFSDAKTLELRTAAYRRLRRHWQFVNELLLFENDHHNVYGIHIYAADRSPSFLHATSLYHPDTLLRSLAHDGSGEEPGFKDPNTGTWDLRPHAERIQRVAEETLKTWQSVTEADDWRSTPMVYTVNTAAAHALETLASQPRLGSLGLSFSAGWHETSDFEKGRFVTEWGPANWEDAILQGPHLHVSTPFFKSPHEIVQHNSDWTEVDLEALPSDAVPVTTYKPAGDRATYDSQYTRWGDSSARGFYRIAWRNMASITGERTLSTALIPPGATHVHTVVSAGASNTDLLDLVLAQASASSILSDFQIRASGRGHIHASNFNTLTKLNPNHPLAYRVAVRAMRLNCLTDAYAGLWEACWDDRFLDDGPILDHYDERPIGPEWSVDVPLRRAEDRRNALVELDVMVALMLGVSVEDLCTIYRTQFGVLYGYDQGRGQLANVFDSNGRQVPTRVRQVWERRGRPADNSDMPVEDRTQTHPGSGIDYVYDLPFRIRDREKDFHTIAAELQNT